MEKLKQILNSVRLFVNAHPILSKAAHTFWQAFLSFIVIGATPIITLVTNGQIKEGFYAALALVIASAAAGLSAAKGAIKSYIQTKINTEV
jgi:hypothetical protein